MIGGALALGAHFLVEQPVIPVFTEWIALFYLGIGPMGGAFFAWDKAMKAGDPRIIGALSYVTPLLSTSILVVLGRQDLGLIALFSLVFIVFGSILGAWELIAKLKRG